MAVGSVGCVTSWRMSPCNDNTRIRRPCARYVGAPGWISVLDEVEPRGPSQSKGSGATSTHPCLSGGAPRSGEREDLQAVVAGVTDVQLVRNHRQLACIVEQPHSPKRWRSCSVCASRVIISSWLESSVWLDITQNRRPPGASTGDKKLWPSSRSVLRGGTAVLWYCATVVLRDGFCAIVSDAAHVERKNRSVDGAHENRVIVGSNPAVPISEHMYRCMCMRMCMCMCMHISGGGTL